MTLQHYAKVRFQRNPLRLVIGQINFPILSRVGEQSYVAPFLDAFRDDYPRSSKEQQVLMQVAPSGISQGAGDLQWRLSTLDYAWSIVLSSNGIILEARQYDSVEEYSARFQRVLDVATEVFPMSERLRLGFRFVNEIRISGVTTLNQWQEFLRPEFLGFPASEAFQGEGNITNCIQQVQVEREDGTLVVRHGLLNGAVVAPAPDTQPDTGPFYLIDLDYFDARAVRLDKSNTIQQFHAYHDVLYNFFRWTLLQALYEAMEPIHVS